MYRAKRVIDIIIDDLKTNLTSDYKFGVHTLYGKRIESFDKFFSQTNAIYVLYQGDEFTTLTQHGIEGNLKIQIVICDQIIGTKDKDHYFVDDVMDHLTWREFAELNTEYPDDDFRPFFPTTLDLFVYDEKKGRAIWVIAGTIGYDKHDVGT